MNALIRAELLKLRTRSLAGLLLATIILVPLTVAADIPRARTQDPPIPLDDPALLAVAVGDGFGVPLVLAFLIGAVAMTQEFRYGTITSTYLVEPRRHRVLMAKFASLALASAAISTATVAIAVPFAAALIHARNGTVNLGTQLAQILAAGYLIMAVYAIVGVAIGALIRNQITVIVAALLWMLAVERVVVPAYPSIGRWMPLATIWALMQLGPVYDPDGNLLSAAQSGLLLATYATMTITLAVRLTPRTDIL